MVKGRNVDLGGLFGVKGLHDVDLDLAEDALAALEDVLIDVLPLGLERADLGEAERVHPELLQVALAQVAQRYLLQTQNVEWSLLL